MQLFNRVFYTLITTMLVISPHAVAGPSSSHENAKIKALMKDGVRVDPPIPTDEWLITLKPGQQMSDIAAQMGIAKHKKVGSLKDTFVITMPSSAKSSGQVKSTLKSLQGITTAEQQIARRVYPRVVISDALYTSQWHLDKSNGTNFSGTPGIDANVENAWNNQNVDGSGVTIGIVDDGFQHTHPDFVSQYNANASYDYNDGDADPSPNVANMDFHGTAVGGVAGADNDGSKCGVGAAYNATMAGLRLIAAPITPAQIAAALSYSEAGVSQKNTIDIFNNSWGPIDFGEFADGAFDAESFYTNFPNAEVGASALALSAIEDGVTNGRDGKGVIYVWAAGNGRTLNDNSNYEGYSNSRFTIAVSAVRGAGDATSVAGQFSSYSEPGANILVTAPSNNFFGQAIRTTDLTGTDGYNAGSETTGDVDCTDSFGGTSSAAPLVAGIVGLMLDANPDLTWRDVQHILVETAVKNHALNFDSSTNTDWTTNGAGFDINHNYGFGLVDANAAVAAAKTWTNVATATSIPSPVKAVNTAIPNVSATGVTSTIEITDDIKLEHVEIVFNATHPFRGDLKIELTNLETGTTSVLSEVSLDPYDNLTNWKFMTVRNWGESSKGTWQLKVIDTRDRTTPEYTQAYSNSGSFDDWKLVLHGTAPAAAPYDFNGDDTSDILLRNTSSGASEIRSVSNNSVTSINAVGSLNSSYTIQGTGDFNADGTTDILWQRTDGLTFIWSINNNAQSSFTSLGYMPSGSTIEGTGDFNADGTSDILWRRADGLTVIWSISNNIVTAFTSLGYLPAGSTIGGTGDYNADGTSDILWRRADGLTVIWPISNNTRVSFASLGYMPLSFTIEGTGYFNADSTSDILWRRDDGLTVIWSIGNNIRTSFTSIGFLPVTSAIEGTGDYNADGTSDILWRRTDGLTVIWSMDNNTVSSFTSLGFLPAALEIQ